MPDELQALERELASLKPRQPSLALRQQLLSRLNPEAETDAQLEQELAGLMPASPSPQLRQRLAAAQPAPARRQRIGYGWLLGLGLLAAAALVLVMQPPANPPASHNRVETVEAPPAAPGAALLHNPTATGEPARPFAFADPRAQAMLAAGYQPVALEQHLVDSIPIESPEAADERQVRVHILQSIRWNHQQSGAQVDTNQLHEAIIRQDLAVY